MKCVRKDKLADISQNLQIKLDARISTVKVDMGQGDYDDFVNSKQKAVRLKI